MIGRIRDFEKFDRSNCFAYDAEFQREFSRLAKIRGRILNHTQIAAIQIANTSAALATYSWMDYFFKLVGDFIPNSNDEIHLEPITIQEIYDEYVIDMEHQGDQSLGYEALLRMWSSCFPYVKIREYKQQVCYVVCFVFLLRTIWTKIWETDQQVVVSKSTKTNKKKENQ